MRRAAVTLVLLASCATSADTAASQAPDAADDPRAHMSDEELTAHYDTEYPLIFAAGTGDVGEVAALLMKACDIKSKESCTAVNERSQDGESALHVNAIKGDGETTKVLLAYGAEVDARTPRGESLHMTPLMWATYGGTPRHKEMVRLLLAAGADPLAADENGKEVLTMAQEAGAADVEALLKAAIRGRQEAGGERGAGGEEAGGEEAGGAPRSWQDRHRSTSMPGKEEL